MTRPAERQTDTRRGSQGAVQSRTGWRDLTRSYWAHHRDSLVDSARRLLATPLQTLMTSLVVAIALALPVTLLLALDNVSALGKRWDANPKVSVYLHPRAQTDAIDGLRREIERYSEVDEVRYLSPDEALMEFQAFSGFGAALEALEQNPLPPTLVISPASTAMAPENLQALALRIKASPLVDDVNLDMDWVRRLQELMVLGRKVVLALACLLSLGVLLAIGNTIRLAIESRRDEILVVKLVGGTDGFVRRPFLYAGGWYGLFGGVLACVIVSLGYAIIDPSVQRLAALYQSDFALSGLDAGAALQLLLISAGLGWLGSWIAVGRHLSDIEPR